ncbi:unnamed protein product [Citrullus colocynthis]|uniref:Uncharacterized protein n=1 Tax=Citrullus colocynthis TaxID=252529 RepID=A0ABP0YG27_9ROSI
MLFPSVDQRLSCSYSMKINLSRQSHIFCGGCLCNHLQEDIKDGVGKKDEEDGNELSSDFGWACLFMGWRKRG